ncbi:hypothetical protein L873DRAFT_1850251 [Choiromyces venosus 120613-1]|uniref:DDE-1 domain-containing protein n=1 Tax=Choiromyces venosus 120613-1 TaxID=1336337 RepID=A0A3N4K613_9PEZI|nr:hypothetical protein L873DRAFT_1850251 [Choiromyces venosus 120613-1]
MPLRKKEPGVGIMVSCFITATQPLRVPESYSEFYLQWHNLSRNALESIEFGGDCWWNMEKMINQIIIQAITIFNLSFPGCQCLFLFDNLKIHDSLPDDALLTYHMNQIQGVEYQLCEVLGLQITLEIATIYERKLKGLQVIVQEHGLWQNSLHLRCGNSQKSCKLDTPGGCCTHSLLSIQEDFLAQKSRLEEVIKEAGHLAILYPKFHCELN